MSKGNSLAASQLQDAATIINAGRPAVAAAHEHRQMIMMETSRGDRLRLLPVSPNLVDEVTERVPVPQVPMWHNEDKGRDEPNPGDPEYQRLLTAYNRERGVTAVEAMMVFGVELIDGVPGFREGDTDTDRKWLRRLAKLGIQVDTEDPDAVELAYIKYVAIASAADLQAMIRGVGLSEEAVQEATKTFQGPA
jgi:hypothetical protein